MYFTFYTIVFFKKLNPKFWFPPQSQKLIMNNIKVHLPEGCYGRIASKSSLSLLGGGIIDQDFQGNIGVILINLSNFMVFYQLRRVKIPTTTSFNKNIKI